jgi:hypothetical protein
VTVPEKIATSILRELSPSGALIEVAEKNYDLDRLLDHFDEDELAIQRLAEPSLLDRLEDDFARCVPTLADAAVPLEAWAIPLLSALVGPAAPILSFGLTVACKVAIAGLKMWAEKRLKRS